MSVLKSKRNVSKAQYVQTSYELYTQSVEFCLRLSARYQRTVGDRLVDAAYKLITHTTCANSIKITNQQTFDLRLNHLIEAKASLQNLRLQITAVYNVIRMNPEGAFRDASGKSYKTPGKAKEIVDNMAQKFGENVVEEYKLLEGVVRSDKLRLANVNKVEDVNELPEFDFAQLRSMTEDQNNSILQT